MPEEEMLIPKLERTLATWKEIEPKRCRRYSGERNHMENTAGVAIYTRVSTEEQAEHGYSIDAQLDTLRNYCKLYDKVIFDEYVDRGVSGKSMDGRFELQRGDRLEVQTSST